MKNNRKMWVAVAMFVTTTVAAMISTGESRIQSAHAPATSATPPIDSTSKQFGTVDYESSGSLEADDKEKRKIKNQRYDNHGWVQKNPHPETAMIGRHTEQTPPPLLPVDESELVLTGRVVEVNTYLSNDKTGVYSEYKIQIAKWLKKSDLDVEKNRFIYADRPGGIVRYPNNQLVIYRHSDFGVPEVGKEYVFFLLDGKSSGSYKIFTLYELQESNTIPLDRGRNTEAIKPQGKSEFINSIQEKLSPVSAGSRRRQ